jgi:hypothetical protein
MSRSPYVYVGPYAMWVEASPPEDDFPRLWGHWGPDGVGEIEPGQEPVPVIFYTPAPDSLPSDGWRTFNYTIPPSGCAAVDFRGVDQEAEIEAFRAEYKTELDALTHQIGRPPVLRWGMIYTYG